MKFENQVRNSNYRKMTIIIAGIVMVLFIVFKVLTISAITAHYEGNKLVFKGNSYKEYYAQYDASDKKIGFSHFPLDGIYALENDSTYNYLYVTNFTSQYLYIKEGTAISTSGDVTMALINYHTNEAITSREDIELILSLEKQTGETFLNEDIPKFNNNVPHNSTIYYCYNNCPVSEYRAGTIWYVEGKWVYFSIRDSNKSVAIADKGVVITDGDIVNKLKHIFDDVYKSANE
ncbi:hypothetical protein KTC96_22340 (plasmid) [Clostridium estertheticum]|uniref:hypothetical protein n=1 Tax=Clostridium estertheticum TaxID=238834 RepID=UPI001C7CBB13|nr:hypothetical protein [Clostridium estertheticum]MBX4260464.1 hypothetical protein [Clostridium estertheticum]WLC72961.1 hypothetical protein KTC96_22340 [Clostridium estertheticum]